ncbi:D-alanyl-D-alanine carboxypeptidase family protein [Desulfosporosinus metallidurans]|uniref:D-alanyl-D-alanine carboxypeptidase n=1 Tax=Desulfosporosinus metallidurans TaxID=1888891 RepID=A0A1Q8QVV6_9FIRM|nr:D-alanyl-D-alanine carboxypeptidase family protein [Desulfosporosinus metallidurans]OLN31474.1 D-alanyl-D-alanine carboxypeptidase [Desulfosporosinus metallidurans]
MKFITALIIAILLFVSVTPTAFAQEASAAKVPQVHGEGAYLIDVQSGQTLFMKNPDEPLAPASTTKIMTGLLAIERGNLDDTVTASSTMLNNKLVYGTQIYLVPGEKMLLKDLLYAMFLNSANDAAVAIAEHIGNDLPNFVKMMNQRAVEIGATQTHFLNPSGLTETGHVTTAHDLALIARAAYQNPLFAQYVRTKSHTISRSSSDVPKLMINENKLLWRDSEVDGIKTGYTAVAQNCLVASVTRDGRQFIGVILKSPGREIYTDMQDMFDYGFTQFKDSVYKSSGSVMSTIYVNNEPVNLILDRPIYVTQKLNEQAPVLNLRLIPNYTSALTSVEEGQVVAHVEILNGETRLDSVPLKTSRTVLPQAPNKIVRSNPMPWISGIIGIGVFITLFNKKRYAARYRSREALLPSRRESNS